MSQQEKSTRELFVEAFGEGQAQVFEQAAEDHLFTRGKAPNKGSDEFRWVLISAIGHGCVMVAEMRQGHGIKVPFQAFKAWVRNYARLEDYDGEVYLPAFRAGVFDGFLPEGEIVGAEPAPTVEELVEMIDRIILVLKAKSQARGAGTMVIPETEGKAN